MEKYNAELSQRLANKIIQSYKDNFTANKDLCHLLGVDHSSYAARKAVFYGGAFGKGIKPKTFEIHCTKLNHLFARVKPVNKGKDMVISYIYQNHLGRGKERERVVKVFAQYPPTKFDVEHDENCVVNTYKRAESDFIRGINYFENKIESANNQRTMFSTWEEYVNSRQLEVLRGDLDRKTLRICKSVFKKHLLEYRYDCDYSKEEIDVGEHLLCKMPLKKIRRVHIKKMIDDFKFKFTREGKEGSELINSIMTVFKGYVVYGMDREWIIENPVVLLKKQESKHEKNIPTREQVMTFLHKMWSDPLVAFKWKVCSGLLLTGHRITTVLSLTWDNIKDARSNNGITTVKVKGRRKKDKLGGNKWKMYLSEVKLNQLEQIVGLHGNPYIFWSTRLRPEVVDGKFVDQPSPLLNTNMSNLFAMLHKKYNSPSHFRPHAIKAMVATETDSVRGRIDTKVLLPNQNDRVLDVHYTPDPIEKADFNDQLLLVSVAMEKHFDFDSD